MTRSPSLTIGLPVFNGEAYLDQALASLRAQTRGDFVVLVSDNASTDATPAIVAAHAAKDPRIRYLRGSRNIGAGPNFNRVFLLSRTPFFKWMAHDDLLAPTFVECCLGALEAEPDLVLAHTALRLVDDSGADLPETSGGRVIDRHGFRHPDREPLHLAEGPSAARRFDEALRRMSWCTAVFGIIRTQALARTHLHGSYYEADRVLLAELALLGRFRQLDLPLMIKRCHGGVSVRKSFREQALMIDPAVWPGPSWVRLRMRAGYVRALAVGDLDVAERARCALTVLRASLRNPLSRRLARALRSGRAQRAPTPGAA